MTAIMTKQTLNRSQPMRVIASVLVLSAGAALTACATSAPPPAPAPHTGSKLTPTEQFGVEVTEIPDRIQLAPNPGSLSPAQVGALVALARRWSDNGSNGVIRVDAPAGVPVAGQAANAAAQVLSANGVPHNAVVVGSYPPAGPAAPTVAVSFIRHETVIPDCKQYISDYTKTFHNEPSGSFGCAVTANFAAQLASPGDLLAVRPEGPSDGARRAVVLGKYREGTSTASTRGSDERGVVSNAIQ